MKALIIGYGSIGQRHHEVLLSLNIFETIDLVTKQKIKDSTTYKYLELVNDLSSYDYFVISSETNKHFDQLKMLEDNVTNKLILCEKPLFESKKNLHIVNNNIFVGYVLRYHPLLQKLKSFLEEDNPIYANIRCGQYLPNWRPNIDYRDSYSAHKNQGGGVLLDLSHEIDYVQWLLGAVVELKSYQLHQSNLEIDSDDLVLIMGKTDRTAIINISIDYISKSTYRDIRIETNEKTFELDLIDNILVVTDRKGISKKFSSPEFKRNDGFKNMHCDILGVQEYPCTFLEGMKVMETINLIQEQNK